MDDMDEIWTRDATKEANKRMLVLTGATTIKSRLSGIYEQLRWWGAQSHSPIRKYTATEHMYVMFISKKNHGRGGTRERDTVARRFGSRDAIVACRTYYG